MATGDVSSLRSDGHLGSREWITAQVRSLGEAEYARVLAIFDRARQQGQAEFMRLREQVVAAGVAQFNGLPWAQQQPIRRQSHVLWVYENGYPQVPEAAAAGTWRALITDPPATGLLARLGTPALTADEQSLLGGRAANDPAVVADPMLASLAARRDLEGDAALRRLRAEVERQGERAFRHQPYATQQAIDQRSRDRFTLDHGFATLSAADRARVQTVDALLDNSGMLAERLGRQALPPAELREIGTLTREAFVAGHGQYVETNGTRLAREALRTEFGGAKLQYDRLEVSGVGGRDLLRRQSAEAHVSWDHVGGTFQGVPETIALRWESRSAGWRIDAVRWASRPGATATEPGANPAVAPPPEAEAPPTTTNDEPTAEGAGQ